MKIRTWNGSRRCIYGEVPDLQEGRWFLVRGSHRHAAESRQVMQLSQSEHRLGGGFQVVERHRNSLQVRGSIPCLLELSPNALVFRLGHVHKSNVSENIRLSGIDPGTRNQHAGQSAGEIAKEIKGVVHELLCELASSAFYLLAHLPTSLVFCPLAASPVGIWILRLPCYPTALQLIVLAQPFREGPYVGHSCLEAVRNVAHLLRVALAMSRAAPFIIFPVPTPNHHPRTPSVTVVAAYEHSNSSRLFSRFTFN
ncbi:hypothetical protein C8R44DRAFT_916168 [Mycena epipterygia]|nr:hypothetical protein C8R44DRAFT_916168 [Mycena epipterygia]